MRCFICSYGTSGDAAQASNVEIMWSESCLKQWLPFKGFSLLIWQVHIREFLYMPQYTIGKDLWNAYAIFVGRFLFRSGNQEHPGDKIENTTVEILPVSVGRCSYTHRLSHLCSVTCKRFWLRWVVEAYWLSWAWLNCLTAWGNAVGCCDSHGRDSQSAFT